MKREIKLTNEDFKKAREFALGSCMHHFRNGRSNDKIVTNIIQGKLGEIAYFQMNPENFIKAPDFEISTTPDPGWDLVDLKQNKIDVKTVKEGTKTITINSSVKADIYAIVEIGHDGIFRLKDHKTRDYLKKNMRTSKFNSSKYIFI